MLLLRVNASNSVIPGGVPVRCRSTRFLSKEKEPRPPLSHQAWRGNPAFSGTISHFNLLLTPLLSVANLYRPFFQGKSDMIASKTRSNDAITHPVLCFLSSLFDADKNETLPVEICLWNAIWLDLRPGRSLHSFSSWLWWKLCSFHESSEGGKPLYYREAALAYYSEQRQPRFLRFLNTNKNIHRSSPGNLRQALYDLKCQVRFPLVIQYLMKFLSVFILLMYLYFASLLR